MPGSVVMLDLISCLSFSPTEHFVLRSRRTENACWAQVRADVTSVTKVSGITDNAAVHILIFKSWKASLTKVELIVKLTRDCHCLIIWKCGLTTLCFLFVILALLPDASPSNRPTHLPTYRWSLYNNVQYCSNTTTRNIFIFRVLKKPLEAVFCFLFFFFCNALAGRRGSYQTRKPTHYLLPLFLLALCSPLRYSKVMASRSQYPQPRHAAQIGGLVRQTERLWRQKQARLTNKVEPNVVESEKHRDVIRGRSW